MLGASIGRGAMRIINAMVRGLASAGVPPNHPDVHRGHHKRRLRRLVRRWRVFWAGVVLIVANLFDMLDGNVARQTST